MRKQVAHAFIPAQSSCRTKICYRTVLPIDIVSDYQFTVSVLYCSFTHTTDSFRAALPSMCSISEFLFHAHLSFPNQSSLHALSNPSSKLQNSWNLDEIAAEVFSPRTQCSVQALVSNSPNSTPNLLVKSSR